MECSNCPVRRLSIYRSASEEDIAALKRLRLGVVNQEKGQLIMADEREGDSVYTILSGWAYSFALLGDGRRQILSIFHPGDFLSISRLYGHGIRASVRALTQVSLCKFDAKELWALLKKSQAADAGVFEYLGNYKRLRDRQLIQLGALDAEEALASLMLEFADAARQLNQSAQELQFPLRLVEIAEFIGVTEIHAGRVFRELESKGAFQRTKPGFIKVNEEKLRSILAPVERLFEGI